MKPADEFYRGAEEQRAMQYYRNQKKPYQRRHKRRASLSDWAFALALLLVTAGVIYLSLRLRVP